MLLKLRFLLHFVYSLLDYTYYENLFYAASCQTLFKKSKSLTICLCTILLKDNFQINIRDIYF
jgi:hypothetical protein